MSSGQVHDVIGPNSSSNTGEDLGQPGDSQLDALLPSGQTTQDAASLTVEFTPTNPQLADQLRVRIGGVRGVRRHRVQRRLRVLRERDQLRAHAGHRRPDHGQHRQSEQQLPLLRPERGRDLRHRVRRLHRGPHVSRRGQPRRQEHVAPRHRRYQRRHPRLRRVPPGVGVSSNPIGPLQPITPNRLLDTRLQATTAGARRLATQSIVPGGTSISVKVTGGDVPDTALAVALNVTAVDGAGPGFLTIFPDGGPQPGTSSVNFAAGAASPNAVVAKIGTGGRIRIFANASVNVIVDVFGWFGPGGNARLFTVVPDRVLDTRDRRGTGGCGPDDRRPDRRNGAGAGRCHRGGAQRHRHRSGRTGLPHGVPVGSRPTTRLERELRSRVSPDRTP